MSLFFDEFRSRLNQNELSDFSQKYLEMFSVFFSKFPREIILTKHLSEDEPYLSERQFLAKIDRLQGEYTDRDEKIFFAIFRIFRGDRFNLEDRWYEISGYESHIEIDVFRFEKKQDSLLSKIIKRAKKMYPYS